MGYNVDNTVRAWALAWSIFAGGEGQRGLGDKPLVISDRQRDIVMPAVEATIEAVKTKVFPVYGSGKA